ncbi:hypothetical protein [Methylobacterium sp. Leaf117]|uniref:hypothetical protein n=1 Tax=Methylobacterium sp. Leaf117 TaxID=1736260 RepID=UPI0012E145BD|nr:hypothetical protein [Methylobacterium sp. Leaf117]
MTARVRFLAGDDIPRIKPHRLTIHASSLLKFNHQAIYSNLGIGAALGDATAAKPEDFDVRQVRMLPGTAD